MEESDEPEQPISLGRQEFRRRRRPSQPMVDKSQQTDAPEKKKPMAVAQPPVPKATLSIGNISGSKDNYSAKEYESLRLSSQLQQTWMKRKRGMEMTDKSLQTEASVEEKAKAILTDKTLTLEETPAGVKETASELPQCVPEVGIPTSRPTDRLIDRSQQTSCTGDFSVMYICPKETVDKEQQTYFSELEITIMNMPGSSLLQPKEETIPATQEGSSFEVDGSLELEVLSGEKVPDAMMPFTGGAFSGEIQALTADELPSEAPGDISHLSVQGALLYEPYDREYLQKAEVDHEEQPIEIVVPFMKIQNVAGKEESATAEESTDGGQPLPPEGAFKEVQPPLDKHTLEAVSAEIAVVLAEEFPIEDVFEGGQRPSAEDAPEEVAPARVLPPPAEEAPAEASLPPAEEAPAEAAPPPAEEAPAEAAPAPAEEASAEAPPAPAEEAPAEAAPAEEAPAEAPPAPAEEAPAEAPPAPAEEAPTEAPLAPAEEAPAEAPPAPAEEAPAEISPPPAEEAPAEAPPAPAEEAPAEAPPAPAEEAPAEAPPVPAEEAPVEASPVPAEEAPAEAPPVPAKEAPVEAPPVPAEEAPAEAPPVPADEAPTEAPPAPAEEGPEEATPAPAEEAPTEAPPAEEAPAEAPPVPAEEAPTEAPLASAEEAPAEAPPAPAEEAPAEAPPPPAEEAPVEPPPSPAEEAPSEAPPASAEEAPVEASPPPVEEAPAEAPPAPAEEAPAEAPPAPAEEAPAEAARLSADDTPAEVEFPPTQETPLQGASVEVQPLSAEEVFTNVVPVEDGPTAETGSPSSEGAPPEETTMETQVTSVEESPEKTSADGQPPPPETPAEDSPVVKQPSKTDGVPIQEFPMQDTPGEGSLAPSEQCTEDKTLLKEHQLPPVAGITEKELDSSSLTGDRNSEGIDPTPADMSRSKDAPVSTFKIAGTIKIELKNPPS